MGARRLGWQGGFFFSLHRRLPFVRGCASGSGSGWCWTRWLSRPDLSNATASILARQMQRICRLAGQLVCELVCESVECSTVASYSSTGRCSYFEANLTMLCSQMCPPSWLESINCSLAPVSHSVSLSRGTAARGVGPELAGIIPLSLRRLPE